MTGDDGRTTEGRASDERAADGRAADGRTADGRVTDGRPAVGGAFDGETGHEATTDGGTVDGTDAVGDVIDEVFAVIEDRKRTMPEGSYTASLFSHEKGENAVLEKLGEEMTELVIAAKDDDHAEIAHEGADIVYHLLVLLSMKGMDVEDLRRELAARR